ncbi:MAG: metallophosphoesterase [Candidatus Aminicenantes bacterium]|nr:metallophosphoesterase [Candidatus Aminicenantes bacterium]
MRLKRREFVKLGGAGLLLTGLDLKTLFGLPAESAASPFTEQLTSQEFPFPYDPAVFEAAERISNVRRSGLDPSVWLTDLNLLVKSGKTLDIKVLVADRREALATTMDVQSFTGVKDSLDLQIRGHDSPRLYYQVQYRVGQAAWKALPPRNFKLPNAKLQNGGQINAFFIGDDHNFDDGSISVPPEYIQTKITGDYFYDFMNKLRSNRNWEPIPPLDRFHFSFYLLHGLYHILASEDPDFIVNLGDSTGIGANYRWEQWGLPFKNLTEKDYDYIARVLWIRSRKTFSAVTPNMPVYWALGNHDGDEAWSEARVQAKLYRQKYFQFPTSVTYPEGGHPDGNYFAFTWGADEKNRGGAQFIILDVLGFNPSVPKKIEEWTLGAEQLRWFEDVLSRNDSEWSFACYHHVLGGWPASADEVHNDYVYGRGPLFTSQDYASYADPAKIEQVKLTELGKKYGLRAFIYGHDHIFYAKRIGEGTNKKDLYGVCAGSTKYIGERTWWRMPFWRKHYGDGFKVHPDFYGPSGITRLSLKSDQARFDYLGIKRTPFSNTPDKDGLEATIYSSLILTNPAPAMQIDKTAFSFETDEWSTVPPPSQVLKVRNTGGQGLHFTATPDQDWISVTPTSGSSWRAWTNLSVSLLLTNLSPGTRNGSIKIESPGTAIAPIQVSVRFVITEAPLYAPLNFAGTHRGSSSSTPKLDTILLTWQENRLNTNVQKYRLYLLGETGGRTRIGETNPATFAYEYGLTRKDRSYRFAIAVVNTRGREGDAAVATIPRSI